MAGNTSRFEIPLFDGKINFMIWQCTIQDLLVQNGLDQALEKEKPATMKEEEWTKIQKKAVSTIRLALAPEIKHNVLKETTPTALWEKLQNIYASKSLTNRLCLKMELYQLKMEMRGNLHDHINKFNQLVSQLLNADDKISDEEQALLLLSSLPRSYKPVVQTLLVGRTTLKMDEVTVTLRENERMMKNENINDEGEIAMAEESERGRNHSRRHDGSRGRSKSQSRPQRDMTNVQCYYCGEKGHLQLRCTQMREDLKKLRMMRKDDDNSQTNVVKTAEDEDIFLATTEDVDKSNWVMDSAASEHICRDRAMFNTLKTNEEFGHFKLGNGEKMKVEGIGSVRMKLHDGAIRTFQNVRFVPSAVANIISLGEMASQGYKYVGSKWGCKVYKGRRLVLRGQKSKKNLCYLEGQALRRESGRDSKGGKKVKFLDDVEIWKF